MSNQLGMDVNFDILSNPFQGANMFEGAFETRDSTTGLTWNGFDTSFMLNGPPNEAPTTTRTVSPKDIFADPLMSAPPSTAFTNLTSPDINDSPSILESYETSPMFQSEVDLSLQNNWFSLFPEETDVNKNSEPTGLTRTVSQQSHALSSASSASSPIVLDNARPRKSSGSSPHLNHSAVAGVAKASRRRKGPLPPIEVDPTDKIAIKRARNTLAARESRQRRYEYQQRLEAQITELKAANEAERTQKEALAAEVARLRQIALGLGADANQL